MARITMRRIRPGEGPPDGGTALPEAPDRPVWAGNGPDDFLCAQCGSVLAARMDPDYMTKKVRVKCAACKTVNVAITDESAAGDPRLKKKKSFGRVLVAGTEERARDAAEPIVGFGSLPRKEDARFIRGRGTYVDDIRRPGMLHGAILRSPLAHARIVSIDASAALALPKVHAVITGADLEARGMAWMPTMSADRQAVLATDKVRFQGQEG